MRKTKLWIFAGCVGMWCGFLVSAQNAASGDFDQRAAEQKQALDALRRAEAAPITSDQAPATNAPDTNAPAAPAAAAAPAPEAAAPVAVEPAPAAATNATAPTQIVAPEPSNTSTAAAPAAATTPAPAEVQATPATPAIAPTLAPTTVLASSPDDQNKALEALRQAEAKPITTEQFARPQPLRRRRSRFPWLTARRN